MPGMNLTREEAAARAQVVANPRYAVELDLTRGADTFVSTSTVEFDAQEGASTWLDLIAPKALKITLNGAELDPATAFVDSRVQLTGLKAHNTVTVTALCEYSHTGEGLHRSVDPTDGRVYLYSQFEVMDARRAYAVFDQPDLKAVFSFSLLTPESWIALSNMPSTHAAVEGTTEEGTLTGGATEGIVKWEFADTPKMSSYLTAFIAGPYAAWTDSYENEDGRTVPMGLYCRQSLKAGLDKDAQYLFDTTKKGFAFYAKTWGVPYPYAKYDQIFVPEYNAGAMENIGTVTIRDSYVFQSKVTDALVDRRVETVLHELAHMWFGDLVTMKWWNDLWLNESFAEYMSTLCTAEATEWDTEWSTFASGEKSWGQDQDELPTTHPIVAPINDIHDTEVNFDGITYAKGASVLKQLVAYVGREKFFTGIHNYLTKHAYGNATLHDLLVELAAASGRDLDKWSALWLETSGINTLTTDIATDENGVITHFALKQSATDGKNILRPHTLRIGFYDMDTDPTSATNGKVVRTDSVEVDVAAQEVTEVPALVGKKRPDFILTNDDDLTYAKLRFDQESLDFLTAHLADFDDALARAVCSLTLWDMTRDAQYPAEQFVTTVLAQLAAEDQSTTFRYALREVLTTASSYVAPARSAAVVASTAEELWKLANLREAGSDEQFQLLGAYLSLAVGDEFAGRAQGLLDGSLKLPGVTIDNNLRWQIVIALAKAGVADDAFIDAQLAQDDTTQNREFAYQARASKPTAEAKEWAWNEALSDESLTNSQIGSVTVGFSSNSDPALYEGYVARFFNTVNDIWTKRTFHMAETLIGSSLITHSLYPASAPLAELIPAGEAWLAANPNADRALRGLIMENVATSKRAQRVQAYNEAL